MDEEDAQHHQGSPELFMFLASTVHDMKNSIGVLNGTLENLMATAPASSELPGYEQLGQMLYQTKRLNDNLIQLLALYKDVGKPGYPFDPAACRISELVEQVAGQARTLLHSRGITLDLDFPQDAIWTMDEDLIIGVLVHAINNAIRYTRDRLRLAVRVDGDYLELRVEDNGAGFPPSLLEAGASAMNSQRSAVNFLNNSSGLGLYFSSEVAKMHKYRQRSGAIALENGGALGGGCFVLRLP
ncbi:sensor histidine kinase [Duganella violaceipulchra]|uniref:histidine kinase n=1 Tax=Duganella violaceipulchra TaxID=2849652 RepID=A0AA41L1Z2_9BURK|nr:HAMP domain-containing sensor histidine kinase [Duganella violaceicalia]MBV6321598.1 HAMP domain-containing histidine kinase [Duganella violaceicalia]MCP2008142.1 signal transduction histidine kinase [Duganella violaceicalia]